MVVSGKFSQYNLYVCLANENSFAILFRYHGTDYAESFWIAGIMIMALNVSFCWVKPLPKGQVGGR